MFQFAINAGLEEALHAVAEKTPEFQEGLEQDTEPYVPIDKHTTNEEREALYKTRYSERFIHDDMVSIMGKLGLRYDEEKFVTFMGVHFPDVLLHEFQIYSESVKRNLKVLEGVDHKIKSGAPINVEKAEALFDRARDNIETIKGKMSAIAKYGNLKELTIPAPEQEAAEPGHFIKNLLSSVRRGLQCQPTR